MDIQSLYRVNLNRFAWRMFCISLCYLECGNALIHNNISHSQLKIHLRIENNSIRYNSSAVSVNIVDI